jgi:hypothetical protein
MTRRLPPNLAATFRAASSSTQLSAMGGMKSPSGSTSSPCLLPAMPAKRSTYEYHGATSA